MKYTQLQRMLHSECLGLKTIRVLHLPGGCGGGRAVRRSKRSEDIRIIIVEDYCLLGINVKLSITSNDCPNSSTTVTSTVWSSVPNLPISTTSGKEQLSAGPPSNEHITDTSRLVDEHENV